MAPPLLAGLQSRAGWGAGGGGGGGAHIPFLNHHNPCCHGSYSRDDLHRFLDSPQNVKGNHPQNPLPKSIVLFFFPSSFWNGLWSGGDRGDVDLFFKGHCFWRLRAEPASVLVERTREMFLDHSPAHSGYIALQLEKTRWSPRQPLPHSPASVPGFGCPTTLESSSEPGPSSLRALL